MSQEKTSQFIMNVLLALKTMLFFQENAMRHKRKEWWE
jgi:hypothetical protein